MDPDARVPERVTTVWFDDHGHRRGQADGMYIAATGQLWQLVRSSHNIALPPCEGRESEGKLASEGLMMVPVGATPTSGVALITELVPKPGAGDASDELQGWIEQHSEVVASLGDFVFVKESRDEGTCGAHGATAVSAAVIDLSRRGEVRLVGDADVAELHAPALAAMRRAAEETGGPGLLFDQDSNVDAISHLAMSMPFWIEAGGGVRMQLRHLFWADACYACSDGMWSSYTTTAWIDASRTPASLAEAAANIPIEVAGQLSSATADGPNSVDAIGVSWGRPDADWKRVFGSVP